MTTSPRWRVGMDTGGTFTDLVALSDQGQLLLRKVSSTPRRPSDAVFAALERTGLDLTRDLDDFVLGTTIATNAVIMRRGAPVILLTTAGFEDVLYIQRIDRPGRYDLQWVKAEPYASRRNTVGVEERVLADGTVRLALADEEVDRVIETVGGLLAEHEGAAIAVSLLNSYLNPDHERALAAKLRAAFPQVAVSLSAEVAPVWREYERTATTAMDAYVSPIVQRFAHTLATGLNERAMSGWHALMKSNGGQVPLEHSADRPIELVLSGLAGGMMGGGYWARAVGSEKAVTLDMGGTSADVGVVVDGQLQYTGLFEVEWGVPIAVPIIDVSTIGAGGSSLAYVGNDGLLHVGPASAGADPGPVCYGRGGTQPTVTDANLVMGRLHPDHFLGGELTLDAERAGTAVAELADSLELGVDAAAEAVLTLAVENMAGAVRLVTVDRGHDYREFDLVAFGGAGPLHAAAIARHMRMRRVIVPPTPGLVSAFGTIISDQRVDRRMTAVRRLDAPEATDLAGILARLAREAHAELAAQRRADATGDIVVTTYVSCRYVGQNYEQEIRTYRGHLDRSYESLLPASPDDPDLDRRLVEMFHASHARVYGYDLPEQAVQSVYVGATALLSGGEVRFVPYTRTTQNPRISTRRVQVGEGVWADTVVVDREELQPGYTLNGPAIVEEPNSTTFVPPGYRMEVDGTYCLIIEAVKGLGENLDTGADA
ncbi:hydantoinase/oxoprolinase family protein [Streptosporangium sp. NPDC002607]